METKFVQTTVTVAIPAYNESANIESVLISLLSQKHDKFKLSEIRVYSDASNDGTDQIVSRLHHLHPSIQLIPDRIRHGKLYRLNQIFSQVESDYVVVLDADIGIVGRHFLSDLVGVLQTDRQAQMVVAHQIPIRPRSLMGKIVYAEYTMWDYVRLAVPRQDHVQNFYGAATAYRRDFARRLHIPSSLHEERAYIYSQAKITDGFRYCWNAVINYWPVSTWQDYKRLINRDFGKNPESGNLHSIPLRYKLTGIAKSFLHQPLYTPVALIFGLVTSRVKPHPPLSQTLPWETTPSSHLPIPVNISKPKIIISSYDCLKNTYYAGGGAIAIHEIAKRLSGDFSVLVICGKYNSHSEEAIDNVLYRQIGVKIQPQLDQLIFQLMLFPQVLTRKYDLWIESFTPPFSTSFLPIFTRRPVIGLVHMLSAGDMNRKYHLPFGLIEKLGMRFYPRFIVTSDYLKQEILRYRSSASVTVISNGINLPPPAKLAKKQQFLYMGRLEQNQKGLDLLISGYELFKKQTASPVKLIIAGSGTPRENEKLSRLISVSPYKKDIVYMGRVTGRVWNNLFRQSLALIIPSRFETFSLSALEGLSFGLPVVCFDLDGLKWIPGSASIKVAPYDISRFAAALNRLSSRPSLRLSLGKSGLRFSAKLTWEKIAAQYKSYLLGVVQNGHAI